MLHYGVGMTRPIRHYPARTATDTTTVYTALCGYESEDRKQFANPAKPEQVTCEGCRDYDRIQSADDWTMGNNMFVVEEE